jgi:hypothetical protein
MIRPYTRKSNPGRRGETIVTFLSFALVVTCILFVSSLDGELHAYLDPGTGSVAIQMILGGAVAALVTGKVYWLKVKAFLMRRQVKSNSSLLD